MHTLVLAVLVRRNYISCQTNDYRIYFIRNTSLYLAVIFSFLYGNALDIPPYRLRFRIHSYCMIPGVECVGVLGVFGKTADRDDFESFDDGSSMALRAVMVGATTLPSLVESRSRPSWRRSCR